MILSPSFPVLVESEAARYSQGARLSGPPWFSVRRDGETATVAIRGEIGLCGPTGEDLLSELEGVKDVQLFITSPGGCAYTGFTVFKGLVGRVSLATIPSECFSAAVIIAMAARKICLYPGARMMVHRSKRFCFGTAADLISAGEDTEVGDARSRQILLARTKQPPEVIAQWHNGRDFYFTAEESVSAGLADEIISPPAPNPAADQMSATAEAPELPAVPTPDEELFRLFLRAFGSIQVRDRVAFTREVAAWIIHNSKDP